MAKVERFEDLTCWQEARALTNAIYQLVGDKPLSQDFRLRDQLTSASVSVMTNIAEGFARYHRKEFIRFLGYSQSSAAEVRSLLYVVLDQGYAEPARIDALQQRSETCRKMVLGLLKHVRSTVGKKRERASEPTVSYDDAASVLDLPSRFVIHGN